jgi:hypothetical protein
LDTGSATDPVPTGVAAVTLLIVIALPTVDAAVSPALPPPSSSDCACRPCETVPFTSPILDRHVDNRTRTALNAVEVEMSAVRVLYQIPRLLIGDRIVGQIIHRE